MLSKDRKLQRDRLEQLQEYINDLEEYKEIEFEKLQQDKLVLRYLTRTLYLALDTIRENLDDLKTIFKWYRDYIE